MKYDDANTPILYPKEIPTPRERPSSSKKQLLKGAATRAVAAVLTLMLSGHALSKDICWETLSDYRGSHTYKVSCETTGTLKNTEAEFEAKRQALAALPLETDDEVEATHNEMCARHLALKFKSELYREAYLGAYGCL